MLTLGLAGGLSFAHEEFYDISQSFTHDAAAVLVEDGQVVAGIEEERLDRIKHSNKFPLEATRFCLERRGVRIQDVDRIAYYATEAYCNALLTRVRLVSRNAGPMVDARTLLCLRLGAGLGCEIDPAKVVFVPHHLAHAASTFTLSGYEQSLILAIDGSGDFLSGLVALGAGTSITPIAEIPQAKSLGNFYLALIGFLGYGTFDEYKVMGLAPYGDPSVFRGKVRTFYSLLPGGNYEIHFDRIPSLQADIATRRKGGPFTQAHKDLAAALQEALEEIVTHVLTHYREQTGERRLCMAGGVAHNCTMNGKILYSGMFDDVFVQPAAHDAGCALGAALYASLEQGVAPPRARLPHVYWGSDIGEEARIDAELRTWGRFLEIEHAPDLPRRVAELLAEGFVVGWAQGRSEFGPRALGNRSILADPRPAENKTVINAMVKKREGYRPFAPSVLEEEAGAFFEIPSNEAGYPFMIFVTRVQQDKHALLGAITHVDGTARIQTVSRKTNPRFWELIRAFQELTGVPMLLNTSFNNNVEPIVDSVLDAVTCFLTTGLHYLAIGNTLVRKRPTTWEDLASLVVALPRHIKVDEIRQFTDMHHTSVVFELRNTYDARSRVRASRDVGELLLRVDGERRVEEILSEIGVGDAERARAAVEELSELWSRRLVILRPKGH